MSRILRAVVALVLTSLFALPSASAAEAPILPPGTILHIRLGTTITSKTNKPGDPFTGQVVQDVTSGDQTILSAGSTVTGHVAFVKPAGRIKGKAQMRIVLDYITTPEDQKIQLSSTLADSRGGVCGSTSSDEEGTIVGCGKSKKEAAKNAALGAGIGAGAGATVGLGKTIDCRYYGNCGGPGLGTDVMYGAGIGAGTVLLYNLFKHEKEIVLVQGTELTFLISRTLDASKPVSPENPPKP